MIKTGIIQLPPLVKLNPTLSLASPSHEPRTSEVSGLSAVGILRSVEVPGFLQSPNSSYIVMTVYTVS